MSNRNRSFKRAEICSSGRAQCELRPARSPAAGRRAGHRCQRCEHARHPSAPAALLQPERSANSWAASPAAREGTAHTVSPGMWQRLSAGRHESHAGAVAEQTFSGSGGRVDHVLAVVEDDDHLAVADRVDEKLGVGHVQRRCDRRGNPRRIADRRELDEVAAVREVARRRSCDLQREPGLSDTTRTDEEMNRSSAARAMSSRSSWSRPTSGVSASRSVPRRFARVGCPGRDGAASRTRRAPGSRPPAGEAQAPARV